MGRSLLLATAAGALTLACGSHASQAPAPADDASHAGPCGAGEPKCPTDRCSAGVCALVELAKVPNPNIFGVDEGYVYFSGDELRALYRAPKCGGATETIALSASAFHGVKLSGDYVYYWLGVSPVRVGRTPKNGGTSEQLMPDDASDPVQFFALQPVTDDVYLSTGSDIAVLPAAGGMRTHLFDRPGITALVGDDRYAYFSDGAPSPGLFRVSKVQSSPELMATIDVATDSRPSPPTMGGDAIFAFYEGTTDATSYLYRIDKSSRASSRIASVPPPPNLVLAADDRCVYFSHADVPGSGVRSGLFRIPATGGDIEFLAAAAEGVAIDDDAYYFASVSYVFRRPK
jgi:hypothetical protein